MESIVIVSGGFDPLHIGHIDYLHEAKKLGDALIVLVNNDAWLINKKGFYFMTQNERQELVSAIRHVDVTAITKHEIGDKDLSINNALREIVKEFQGYKITLANGGDRTAENIPEYDTCKELGIEMVFGVGGNKVQSSSNLIKRIKEL